MKLQSVPITLALLFSLLPSWSQSWESLFDGETLNGWKAFGQSRSFHVSDRQLIAEGPRACLYYIGASGSADFTNFECNVEVLTRDGAASGLCFHADAQAKSVPAENGMKVQILNEPGLAAGRETKLTGSLYDLRNVYKPLSADDEWVSLNILVRGKRVQIRVNDVMVVDYFVPPAPKSGLDGTVARLGHGTFALECHGGRGRVLFRNLRVRSLPDEPENATLAPSQTKYEREVARLEASDVPVVNHHVHLKGGLSLSEALEVSRRTGVFYGIAVNCGLNFSVTNDAGIYDYLKSMKGQPVFAAMQAEGREWVNLFSKSAVSQFDYVFTDSMTIFDEDGRRMRLWLTNEVPEIKDPQAFMDMLVGRTVKILNTEPIDVYVNPTFLPAQIAGDYERLWTRERMKRVITAAARHNIAIEINSRYRLPSPAFLRLAKAAGCKFTFGTNNTGRDIGELDYSFQMVSELGLKGSDIWLPRRKAPTRG